MEDILASIRRILNDGEAEAAPASDTAGPTPNDAVLPKPAGASLPEPDGVLLSKPDGVFLLDQTMLIEEPAAMSEPEQEPLHVEAPAPDFSHLDAGEPPAEPLLAASTAAAASASLGALVRVVGQRSTQVYRGGPTLEDMVRDEIRPLVKAWLDENLAPMVERLVRTEIERVTRNG